MKNTDTVIVLNRLGDALARQGVKLKRSGLLQVAASAFGYRNEHEFTAAAAAGDLTPPEAAYMGRTRVANIGWMHFFQQPNGTVFAIDQEAFDGQTPGAARWILSPLGEVFDVSMMTGAVNEPVPHERTSGRENDRAGPEDMACAPAAQDPAESVSYMTTACCEVADVTKEDLDALGLPYGTFDDEFYPLTAAENEYVADDVVTSCDGLRTALMGRSVLYGRRKHFMPTMEMPVGADQDAPEKDDVVKEARAYAKRILGKVTEYGGTVIVDDDMEDRISIGLAIPTSVACLHEGYDSWKDAVAWLMVDPDLPTVEDGRYPIRHEGRDFAVELDWIGEGHDGEYSRTRQDHPLLRFDAQRRTPEGWEPIDGGSYCSMVHAYCDPDVARGFARMLVETLDAEGDSSPRLKLGEMSWMDETTVSELMQRRTMRDATAEDGVTSETDEYVAHVTYGNPDHGTSIDLRRRADGSVRCEVYVDLTCADAFERSDMAGVRAHLKTLDCDVEPDAGDPLPSHALASRRNGEGEIVWTLLPKIQDEAGWRAANPDGAPDAVSFVPIDRMIV